MLKCNSAGVENSVAKEWSWHKDLGVSVGFLITKLFLQSNNKEGGQSMAVPLVCFGFIWGLVLN